MRSNAYGGGSSPSVPSSANLPPWQDKAIEAVGRVISFWGFKENHGRIWAYLYLLNKPKTVAEIREGLGLSKGAASMLLQDLENWSIVLRSVEKKAKGRQYQANEQLMQMITQVFKMRESGLIQQTIDDLDAAEALAQEDKVDPLTIKRLQKMKRLAELMRHILRFVGIASKLDINQIISILPIPDGGKK